MSSRRSLPVIPLSPTPIRPQVGADVTAVEFHVAPVGPYHGPRLSLITLGCDKNTVDSEHLMATLVNQGAQVSSDVEGADAVIVNTCGFIEAAKEQSVETILEACELKAAGRTRAVVAVGCMVQRYKAELEREIPEVDLFLGLTELDRLVPELRARGLLPPEIDVVPNMARPLRILATETPHTSFLKISEGCDHTCAFCAIPLMRGRHRSAALADLVREASELEARGVRELNIVSQDTTWYGRDLRRSRDGRGAPLLPDLLCALLERTSVPWYRLFYLYPSGITPELVALIASNPRLVPYLDTPIQHGSDTVLTRMRRPERRATIRERVSWLRDAIPGLKLRTTVIVGFPGETEREFTEMLDLLDEVRFDRVGAFTYSVEEGTRAAEMPDQVPESLKRERLERLLDVQRGVSLDSNLADVGQTQRVLVDRVGGDGRDGFAAVGRTAGQALDIDGVTYLRSRRPLQAGQFVDAKIAEAGEDDLVGVVMAAEGGNAGP
ncbi:MAG: 30S ribosomal protein S12 methylthiotransferase RimO [Gemmatimonadetes bacterium]|nr:30S ribosomal protein S12 methylthiotransferase RimO [Gemmatimonadota bacterium]